MAAQARAAEEVANKLTPRRKGAEEHLKSVEAVARVHKKQVLTYLRLSNLRLGLLISFGEELIKDGISRIVNGL